jgi:hypothetical protein
MLYDSLFLIYQIIVLQQPFWKKFEGGGLSGPLAGYSGLAIFFCIFPKLLSIV